MKTSKLKKKNVQRKCLTFKLYDKIIKISSKSHETIPLSMSPIKLFWRLLCNASFNYLSNIFLYSTVHSFTYWKHINQQLGLAPEIYTATNAVEKIKSGKETSTVKLKLNRPIQYMPIWNTSKLSQSIYVALSTIRFKVNFKLWHLKGQPHKILRYVDLKLLPCGECTQAFWI
jgi:hypothetical protein